MELTAALPSHGDFLKMHGLGNDFIVVDGRSAPFGPTPGLIRRLCDRHRGVGGDLQVEVLADYSLTLTGPVAVAFSGRFPTDGEPSP